MKLSNLFKKATTKNVGSNVQKLEKTQLEKVIGGIDTLTVYTTTAKGITQSGISVPPSENGGK